MTYTAPNAKAFTLAQGTLAKKITDELALVDAALDALGSGSGLLADGKIWIGGATGACAAQTVSGDVTITRAGVTTVAPLVPLNLSGVVTAAETTGTAIQIATTGTPLALNTAGQSGIKAFFSSTATSDTTYGMYCRLDSNGVGQEGISGRFKTLLKKAGIGNAHGMHATLEADTSAGAVTGLGTGIRGNLVVANRALTTGTYYGVMAEIYPLGNTAAIPASSNACLGINAQAGTAMDAVVNAISFSGTDGSGSMIYTHNPGNTFTGSIRILVNGAVRYLYTATAA
jgi:hypothetical protein